MEDNLQTIVIVIISVFLLFIFPVYMAYEKKDDISYALAMRYTQDLVDEVRSKGYITKYMYEDYRAKLKITGNSYDINMTHEYNRYDPITNYYTVDKNGKYTLVKSTTQEEKENIIKQAILSGILDENITNDDKNKYVSSQYAEQLGVDEENIRIEDTYQISKQIYTTKHIESVLNTEKKLMLNANKETIKCKDSEEICQYAYIMNVDDNFNVTIKNTNTTLATVIYNMVTANTLDKSTRIYVNYGGTILSNKWYGDIDYAKMDHEGIGLDKLNIIEEFPDEYFYEKTKAEYNVINNFTKEYDGEYTIEFDVKPTDVTVLRQKGDNINSSYPIQNYSGYNFAIGNNKQSNNNSKLSVSVGLNGISLVTSDSLKLSSSTTTSFTNFPTYKIPYETTCPDIEQYQCNDVDENGEVIEKTCEREIQVLCTKYQDAQREITDYSELRLICNTKGKINIRLKGKTSSVENINEIINIKDEDGILVGLDRTIYNPMSGTFNGTLGETLVRGTNIRYWIYISDRNISVAAEQEISNEMTILSYPATIEDYTNVRIELKEKENYKGIYNALLYLNSELVDQSIDLNYIPKVNVVGMTIIGNEEPRYFNGYIKNAKLYN